MADSADSSEFTVAAFSEKRLVGLVSRLGVTMLSGPLNSVV